MLADMSVRPWARTLSAAEPHEEAMRPLHALRLILSGQSGVEDAHVVAANNLTRLLGREPGAQHRPIFVSRSRIIDTKPDPLL
jgi:hypothetical protein